MKKLLSLTFTALLLLAPLALSGNAFANNFGFLKSEPELMPVDQAFAFDFKQEGNKVTLNWVIADGYYMYRDKLKFSVNGAELGTIDLPKGKPHNDEYFGEQEVYYTYIDIPVGLKQADDNGTLSVTFMGCAEGKLCYPPTKRDVSLKAVAANDGQIATTAASDATEPVTAQTNANSATNAPITQQDSLSQMLSNDSLLWTLVIFFGLGIGLALTPCVFPMYPILSGIIVGQGQKLSTAKAFTLSMAYVQGMAITYSILGLVVASAGMKYQAALQHPAVLVVLAILFFVLSLSMFGLYDLKLPSRFQEKMNSISNNQKGGNLIGVFLMGVISGLVASPCTTAPLSGALVYVAQTGDLLQGFLALYVLSMGMGVPLLIIGTSGGKLLPRAGAWMNIIKTVFGFLLIAVSIVMLGRIWTGVVSDVLWSLWGISFTGYLMHQNKLSAFNWKQTVRSVLLMLTLLASFSYGFQAVMGHFGFNHSPVGNTATAEAEHGFKHIKSIEDLDRELAAATAAGKPVMLDLYADWCVACKEFEAITFKDAEVLARMNKIVLLQADVTKSDAVDVALLEKYHVLGLPTLLMFNEQGEPREDLRVTGFMGPKEFAAHLDHLVK
ncbi:protein-disulfide reductase DsbD [Shewanella oneidensis MR-1]|uniref:Thiol:disulfide interchange protein DsbD n=1 Tax=Shewanella oneidensis (strain ATCC 700550 / JCM 31522 / CIP 106686 / LMG 19005 / NCIMB 14063 / MR-1) TaxID=211586 RepID=Q8EIY1_SHEON|nr:protein-disulfide reductase DsbD [Shewanella oneidensis]AAN53774.1 protein-disulfide reductase DsbD [Shewanella oneidensis MR-1]MDX5997385.1 protein-disulfide reductase DsbD [Shewanella oneidensis]MEE2028811.1 Thiol:disulfide interchange protein DsbD [Shewanella oneidensis]QKG95578.1 protein-disulfide reductase DsbD [Shewanella oneidensis MR-1]